MEKEYTHTYDKYKQRILTIIPINNIKKVNSNIMKV